AACHSLGYTREELLTMTVHDIDPNFPKGTWKLNWNSLKLHKTRQIESRHRTKDNKIFPVEITSNYMEFNGREYNCALARDITYRKVSGQVLRGLSRELKKIVEVSTCELIKTNDSLKREINVRKNAEKALNKSLEQLSKKNRYESIINIVTRSVHQSIDLQEVLENAVDAMSKNIDGVDNVSIFLVEREEAVLKSYRGYTERAINRLKRIPYAEGFTWKTIIEEKPRYVADVDKDSVIGTAGKEFGTKSYASMPITFNGKTVGALNINSLHKNAFDEEELKLLEVVSQQIGVAIKNAKQAEYLRISEEALQRANEELELRVKERTKRLSEKNKELKKEIAKRRNAEEKTKASLYEKELLVKEIQHRVKNNLQVITSLLDLQNEYVKDGTFKNILVDVQNRIRSMALIHEQIFQSNNVAKIDFDEYIRNLVTYIFSSYGVNTGEIGSKIIIRDASLNVNRAIVCGLIINELVSNSLKHAFPKRERGQQIDIELYSENQKCVLSISDNGIGFPKDLNFRKTESLGLQLVLSLTRQLEGSLQLNRKHGTEFKIVFPEK
ncbi:MAG: histidine kinase dimerization/phosphoacceptor domain -containing protein, partial [Thermodesulfobacteriota bacterium]